MPDDELQPDQRPDQPGDQPGGQPSELSELAGVRPDMDRPRPLRVPSSPQREHIMAEAEALRLYVERGGAVAYFRSRQPGERARVSFLVERDRFNRIASELRAERSGRGAWVWTPKRGLHRLS